MRWAKSTDPLIATALVICAFGIMNGFINAGETEHREPSSMFDIPAQIDKYGIAAVAGILLAAMWRAQERMSRSLETHEKILVELVREAACAGERQAAALTILCKEMRNRPCLKDIDKE